MAPGGKRLQRRCFMRAALRPAALTVGNFVGLVAAASSTWTLLGLVAASTLAASALPLHLLQFHRFSGFGAAVPRRLAVDHRGRLAARCPSGATAEGDDPAAAGMGMSVPSCVTPIGPFCGFRSKACALGGDLSAGMDNLNEGAPQFQTDMAKLSLEAQLTGREPDRESVRKIAEKMEGSLREWEKVINRLSTSTDFQSTEYYKMTESHLARQGKSFKEVGELVKFQVYAMQAYADGRPPPHPPPGLDLTPPPPGSGSPGPMATSSAIDSEPFIGTEDLFKNPVVREEYETLIRDHAAAIRLGENYGSFDPLGKLAFLDQIEAIETRWDIFFGRFALMGGLNPEFREQSAAFLESMGLNVQEFRQLLKKAHALMRTEAEAERQ